jgi:hypothetical protein
MRGFTVLLKKELREHIKTHKLLIVLVVFLFLGMGTPLMLHYLPDIVNSGGGTEIPMPDFTGEDAASEFFGSIAQIGMVVVILVAMGAVARERERGTALLTLSKPVGRDMFIAAKLAALAVIFGISLILGAAFCYLYIYILFGSIGAASYIAATALLGLLAGLHLDNAAVQQHLQERNSRRRPGSGDHRRSLGAVCDPEYRFIRADGDTELGEQSGFGEGVERVGLAGDQPGAGGSVWGGGVAGAGEERNIGLAWPFAR